MADFFKCCFPSARKLSEDDEIELVSAAALPSTRRKQYNDRLKDNISRPRLQPERTLPPSLPRPSNPYTNMRRPSEDLQDLVNDEASQDISNNVTFSPFDRAHAHVLRDLNSALQHSRWAVSGSYAESLWGCTRGKRRNTVSIFCQTSTRDTTKVWLTSRSFFTATPDDENVLQYQGDLMGAASVFVRIRWVSDREFERFQIIKSTFNYLESPQAPVSKVHLVLLTLPSLADNLAWSWVNARSSRAREDFAADLFSALERIVDLGFSVDGSGPLNVENNFHTMSKAFWIPFTTAFPHAPALFAQCGLPIPKVGIVTSQPKAKESMQMGPPALRYDSLQRPRSAPVAPPASEDYGRSLTKPSSCKRPSSTQPPSSSKHSERSSSSKAQRPSSRTKAKARPLSKDEIHPAPRSRSYHRDLTARPVSPEPSPQRPVHPANILQPDPAPRSKISALFGLKESPESVEHRRQEKLENDRAARRASEKLAAKIQRNRERDREREWHTRKQAERMGLHEPPKNLSLRPQHQDLSSAEAGPSPSWI